MPTFPDQGRLRNQLGMPAFILNIFHFFISGFSYPGFFPSQNDENITFFSNHSVKVVHYEIGLVWNDFFGQGASTK